MGDINRLCANAPKGQARVRKPFCLRLFALSALCSLGEVRQYWTYAKGGRRKEDGKPFVTAWQYLCLNNLPPNFTFLAKDLFVGPQHSQVNWRSRQNPQIIPLSHLSRTNVCCPLLSASCLVCSLTLIIYGVVFGHFLGSWDFTAPSLWSHGSHSFEKSLNFRGSPWKVLEFHFSLKSP